MKDYILFLAKQFISCKRSYLTQKEARFLKGKKKLQDTFDLIQIFKAVRNIQLISKIILAKH